jgi:hypothetical protein
MNGLRQLEDMISQLRDLGLRLEDAWNRVLSEQFMSYNVGYY